MAFRDIREFIAKLEETGDIQKIEQEVDWNLEIGAIMRRVNETGANAPFFQKIRGYGSEHRLFGCVLSTFRRLAIAMGLSPDTTPKEMIDIYEKRFNNPIKPVIVKDGPCKENIMIGDEVNLYKFPAPMIHDGDGGRYFSTWHVSITKDPDTDWVNWGMYRQMIHNRNTLGGLILPTQHIGLIYYPKYEGRGKPMPFAYAIGPEPISTFIATTVVPYGVNEADIVGGIRQEPIELIKCETNDLYVPATAEVVVEGEVEPNIRVDERPFGEYTGYRASPRAPRPIFRVKAITHRNNPVFTSSCMGVPYDSFTIPCAVTWSAELRRTLLSFGIPIIDVYVHPVGATFWAIVSTHTAYANIATKISSAIWANPGGQYVTKVMVVNGDVDVFDINDVMHAFVTKLHPVRGITVIENAVGWPLMPYANLDERLWGKGANVCFDLTWPIDWPPEIAIPPKSSFKYIYPERIQKKVLDNWKNYGYE